MSEFTGQDTYVPFNGDIEDELFRTTGLEYISETHLACVFLLDTSGSMCGSGIDSLNEGLETFRVMLSDESEFDARTRACIDVAVVTFDSSVEVVQDFIPAAHMPQLTLTAGGTTSMGAALTTALDMVAQKKAQYRSLGISYYRPWVYCITDGMPTDDVRQASERLKAMEKEKGVLGYCVGVDGCDFDAMQHIFDSKRIFKLDNLDFNGLFQFVSNSLAAISSSGAATSGGTIEAEAPSTLRMAIEF